MERTQRNMAIISLSSNIKKQDTTLIEQQHNDDNLDSKGQHLRRQGQQQQKCQKLQLQDQKGRVGMSVVQSENRGEVRQWQQDLKWKPKNRQHRKQRNRKKQFTFSDEDQHQKQNKPNQIQQQEALVQQKHLQSQTQEACKTICKFSYKPKIQIQISSQSQPSSQSEPKKPQQQLSQQSQHNYQELAEEHQHESQRQFNVCTICYDQQSYEYGCKCEHLFCYECYCRYFEYRMHNYEEVVCPQQNCHQTLSTDSQLFDRLPQSMKIKYHVVNQIRINIQQYSHKIEQQQQCDSKSVVNVVVDDEQLQQYTNLPQQTPTKLKSSYVVHQNQPSLSKFPKQQLTQISMVQTSKSYYLSPHYEQYPTNTDQSQAKNNDCCQTCAIRFLLYLLYAILKILQLIKYILLIVLIGCFSIIVGVTFQPCFLILRRQNRKQKIMFIVFYPITMIYGIGLAFKKVFYTCLKSFCQKDRIFFQRYLKLI